MAPAVVVELAPVELAEPAAVPPVLAPALDPPAAARGAMDKARPSKRSRAIRESRRMERR